MRNHALKLASLLSIALAVTLFAPQRAAADEDDPPARVARLGYTHGTVSFQPAGTDDWVSAVVNRPMTTGDKLWSDNGARAELHIGSASIRLSGNTGFAFLNLTDNTTQLRLTEGTLRVRVKRLDENETFEIDTPNLAFSVLRPGVYKINVNEGGDSTMVQVRAGEGEVTGEGTAYTIHANEVGTFSGTDQLNADVGSYGYDEDDFDHWCADRDRHEDRSVSARYVSTDVIGYEDLDDYGGWRPVPEYGTIWFPHTAIAGWAPYHYGHWAYIAPWGYTWVDDAPWGFAPFHYGRWVTVGGVWGWVPCPPRPVVIGVVYVRPVYAPALVAWVGGPHFGIGIGIGGGVSVGWFPLGPREVYVPSYPVSRTYVNNVNISNTTVNNTVVNNYYNNTVINKNVNVTNVKYVNQGVPGAVTATTSQAFTSAQPIAKNSMKVNQKEVASAPVNVTTPAVAPAKQGVLGSGAPSAARPPAAWQSRSVVAKTAPPPAPVSFAKQQQAIQSNGGKPLAMSQVREIQPETAQAPRANIKIAPPARPATPQNAQSNRPGQPQNNVNSRPGVPNNAPQQANRPGNPPSSNAPANKGNAKPYNDRPPTARPANPGSAVSPQLDQRHQQQVEQLRQKQDQERQRIEQRQQQDRARMQQKNADEQRQQHTEQKHNQQLQQLEQKHEQEQQKLQQKQQQERQKQQPAAKPQPKPQPKEDRPPHR
jgi:hypothetical protein